ncbi:MAG: 50S ribosomal protein L23 [Gammaproteobacteria bacterium]|nr:50S ribosomal protein L23 [Gammaproteobacteria bacterium]MDH5800543.1 50S ribosomal protein L23 [Gammaproteobacteria bacterium]
MNFSLVANILLSPHVTEKATMATELNNQYVFKVASKATKPQIKQAVEKMFEVQVDSVRVLNVKGKQKRFGMQMGQRKGWKKAYVRLKDGQTIDLVGGE